MIHQEAIDTLRRIVSLHKEYKKNLHTIKQFLPPKTDRSEKELKIDMFTILNRITKYKAEAQLRMIGEKVMSNAIFDFPIVQNGYWIKRLYALAPDNERAKYQVVSLHIKEVLNKINRDWYLFMDDGYIKEIEGVIKEAANINRRGA